MKFVKLATRLVGILVVEFGDAPLFAFHLSAAVVMEFLGSGADLFDEVWIGGLGKGEGFKASVVSVGNISFQGRFLGVHPGAMKVGCKDAENVEII